MIWGAEAGVGALVMQGHLGLRWHLRSFPALNRSEDRQSQARSVWLVSAPEPPGLTAPSTSLENKPGITLPLISGSHHWPGACAFLKNPHDQNITSPSLSLPFFFSFFRASSQDSSTTHPFPQHHLFCPAHGKCGWKGVCVFERGSKQWWLEAC